MIPSDMTIAEGVKPRETVDQSYPSCTALSKILQILLVLIERRLLDSAIFYPHCNVDVVKGKIDARNSIPRGPEIVFDAYLL